MLRLLSVGLVYLQSLTDPLQGGGLDGGQQAGQGGHPGDRLTALGAGLLEQTADRTGGSKTKFCLLFHPNMKATTELTRAETSPQLVGLPDGSVFCSPQS